MYPNLRAEFARKNLTQAYISKRLGINTSTLNNKLKKGGFTLREAHKIKQIIGSDLPIEELFKEDE